jgi:hypothetical protein
VRCGAVPQSVGASSVPPEEGVRSKVQLTLRARQREQGIVPSHFFLERRQDAQALSTCSRFFLMDLRSCMAAVSLCAGNSSCGSRSRLSWCDVDAGSGGFMGAGPMLLVPALVIPVASSACSIPFVQVSETHGMLLAKQREHGFMSSHRAFESRQACYQYDITTVSYKDLISKF